MQSATAFAKEDESNAEMILGYGDDDAAFVAGGTVVMFGKAGRRRSSPTSRATSRPGPTGTGRASRRLGESSSSRTTVRAAASGARSAQKIAAWAGDPIDKLEFVASPWAKLKLSREDHRAVLAEYMNENGVEVLIAGPIVSLGMVGGGTPDEVSTFEEHLQALRDLPSARCS